MGKDAASIAPKFVPDYELQARDDSGGPEYDQYTAAFGDGGYVAGGAKAHLSASGGTDDPMDGDIQSDTIRSAGANRALGQKNIGSKAPASSVRAQKVGK